MDRNSGQRDKLGSAKRLVIKIGSALLTNDGKGLDRDFIQNIVVQLSQLREAGIELVLVSSGSVAEGMTRLGLKERPQYLHELQAAAAIGQMGLVQAYESCFQKHQLNTAQVLLTHDDLSDRKRYLNARSTINTLIDFGVIPIINENDTVVTDEIKFGDNDTLGALVANLVEADGLIILTDQDGMYDSDPRHNANASLLHELAANDPGLDAMAGARSGSLGRGGMQTKLKAARLASRSGAFTVIAGGRIDSILPQLLKGERLGTYLYSDTSRQLARKQWLAGHLQTKGKLVLDAGAVDVILKGGKSLLPIGVISCSGRFRRGEIVSCFDEAGQEIARGLVNYDQEDAKRIVRLPSENIISVLGFSHAPELIHRDNLVLV